MDLRETGLKPLNGFRLKAGLRRGVSPTQISPSEYRLQPEVCEGLQARVYVKRALCRLSRLPATAAHFSMPHRRTPVASRSPEGTWKLLTGVAQKCCYTAHQRRKQMSRTTTERYGRELRIARMARIFRGRAGLSGVGSSGGLDSYGGSYGVPAARAHLSRCAGA